MAINKKCLKFDSFHTALTCVGYENKQLVKFFRIRQVSRVSNRTERCHTSEAQHPGTDISVNKTVLRVYPIKIPETLSCLQHLPSFFSPNLTILNTNANPRFQNFNSLYKSLGGN